MFITKLHCFFLNWATELFFFVVFSLTIKKEKKKKRRERNKHIRTKRAEKSSFLNSVKQNKNKYKMTKINKEINKKE